MIGSQVYVPISKIYVPPTSTYAPCFIRYETRARIYATTPRKYEPKDKIYAPPHPKNSKKPSPTRRRFLILHYIPASFLKLQGWRLLQRSLR